MRVVTVTMTDGGIGRSLEVGPLHFQTWRHDEKPWGFGVGTLCAYVVVAGRAFWVDRVLCARL
jgi:hypothetical protein